MNRKYRFFQGISVALSALLLFQAIAVPTFASDEVANAPIPKSTEDMLLSDPLELEDDPPLLEENPPTDEDEVDKTEGQTPEESNEPEEPDAILKEQRSADGIKTQEALVAAINAAPDNVETTIEIDDNIVLEQVSQDSDASSIIQIPANKNIVLTSTDGNIFQISPAEISDITSRRHFYVSDSTLTLRNITLTGNRDMTSETFINSSGGIILNNATLILDAGATIQNCAAFYGAAVNSHGSTITMYEGALVTGCIANNYGAGFYLNDQSTFTMYGGEISHNVSSGEGGAGGVLVTDSEFFMEGGSIKNNILPQLKTQTSYGAGVLVGNSGIFTMSGGEISGNRAANGCGGGVAVVTIAQNGNKNLDDPHSFIMNGGTIKDNIVQGQSGCGGGVFVFRKNGLFEMNHGTIENNTSVRQYGGGIHMDSGTSLSINNEDCYILNNSAPVGGGISLRDTQNEREKLDPVFTMHDGLVQGNTASSEGGGLYCYYKYASTPSKVTITKGAFADNKATYGGGIYLHGDYTYGGKIMAEISNVTITGNMASNQYDTYNTSGGGIHISSNNVLVNLSDSEISNNSATRAGGGIYSSNTNLTVSNCIIADNVLKNEHPNPPPGDKIGGGGVAILFGNPARFIDCTITGNTSSHDGGGIFYHRHSATEETTLSIEGTSQITNNIANKNGGGINTVYSFDDPEIRDVVERRGLEYVEVGENVTFSDNIASKGYLWTLDVPNADPDSLIHNRNVLTTKFTAPFTNAYSNYDINYERELPPFLYPVIYDANGGSGAGPIEDSKEENDEFMAAENSFTPPADHIFLYWSTTASGDDTTYQPGDMITMPAGPLTLYAIWKSQPKFTVTYKPGAASAEVSNMPAPISEMLIAETKYMISTTTPTRSGYTFTGWLPSGGGLTQTYQPGEDFIMPSDDVTLTAQWSKDGGGGGSTYYTITYNANGGTGTYKVSGISPGTTHVVSTLQETKITYDGYRFLGWNTMANGVVVKHFCNTCGKKTFNF